MISSEALKNALSKPSCISISSTAKPIPSLDRSSRGLFANKFRQASGTNPLDMSGPRHIPHGYFRWDASAMNAHSSERRSPLTRRWSGQDSNFESLHGKLAEPRIKTRAVGPSVPPTQGFVLIEIPVNPNQQTFLDVVGKYSARPSTGEVSSFDVVVYSPREVTR